MDAEMSGVSLWAKTKPALDFVSGQFQSKTAQQIYHAFVVVDQEGELLMEHPPIRDASGRLPDTFTVDYWLGPDTVNSDLMRVFARNGGQVAQSEFRVQENFGEFALVEGRPQTNRRHQVRAHLAAAGAPVLNDALYGDARKQLLLSKIKRGYKGGENERPMIRSLALHLSELTFTHPVSREEMNLSAPLPLEFEIALKNLRKFGRGRLGRR
jgi:23S rRNA-/tRNA-specific pseudouridylate synthase